MFVDSVRIIPYSHWRTGQMVMIPLLSLAVLSSTPNRFLASFLGRTGEELVGDLKLFTLWIFVAAFFLVTFENLSFEPSGNRKCRFWMMPYTIVSFFWLCGTLVIAARYSAIVGTSFGQPIALRSATRDGLYIACGLLVCILVASFTAYKKSRKWDDVPKRLLESLHMLLYCVFAITLFATALAFFLPLTYNATRILWTAIPIYLLTIVQYIYASPTSLFLSYAQ